MTTKRHEDFYALALIGARTQLNELAREARLLIGLFPHLRDSFDNDELPVSFILRRGRDRVAGAARRRASGVGPSPRDRRA
jgi:hypothetical protein